MTMEETKKDDSHLPLEVNGKDESWEATLAHDLDNENRARDFPIKEDQNGISFPPCPNAPVSDTNPFSDKNVLECELPELVVCYKELDYHVVKDICVDEGMPVKDKILIENYDDEASKKDELVAHEKTNLPLDSSLDNDSGENCVLDDEESKVIQLANQEVVQAGSLSYNSEVESGRITFNFNAPEKVNGRPIDSGDHKDSSGDKGSVHEQQPLITEDGKSDDSSGDSHVQSGNSNNRSEEDVREQQSISSSTNTDDSSGDGQVQCGNSNRSEEDVREQQSVTNTDEQAFDGESSFAVSRVTYSGPISVSGSVSLRSEGSGTSARSFAFPVLANEWNSSPVRMAKADERHFRKHKGWRSGLLCCRF